MSEATRPGKVIDAKHTGKRESIERLLGQYAEMCLAYKSVKGCIDCSWTAEIEET